MKTSNFLLFLAIYGGITGALMLFDGKGSLESYGVTPDQYHIATIQYLGISNLALAILIFFIRKEISQKVMKTILMLSAIEMIGSSLKGFYDVEILLIPGNTFFWADAIFRALVGCISLFVAFKISTKTV